MMEIMSESDSLWDFLKEKVYLYLIAGALVQRLFVHDVDGGHPGFISIYGNLASI